MSRSFRAARRRGVIGAAAVVVAVSSSVVAIQGLAGAAKATPAPPPQPPTLDHFLCYQAFPIKPFKFPPKVVLKNQFTAADGTKLKPTIQQEPLTHCNPVAKYIGGSLVSPITNPNAHRLCYPIQVATQPAHVVQVTNQFGQALLDTGQPSALCLPTWKSLTGPPNMTPNQPPGLDHSTCYPVTYDPNTPTRFNPPPNVAVQDQFVPAGAGPVPVQIGNPLVLCLPTTKKVVSATGVTTIYPPSNPTAHLLCFQVSQTPFPTTVWDENQFGTRQIQLQGTTYLCLPSQKTLVH